MSNTKAIINKNKVILSSLFIPMAIPFFALCLAFTDIVTEFDGFFMVFLGVTFLGLLWGAAIWIPSMIFCMMVETVFITKKANKNTVIIVLVAEALAACTIIHIVVDIGTDEFLLPLAISIVLTQCVRWLYLIRKNRMYDEGAIQEDDDSLIDDIEI